MGETGFFLQLGVVSLAAHDYLDVATGERRNAWSGLEFAAQVQHIALVAMPAQCRAVYRHKARLCRAH